MSILILNCDYILPREGYLLRLSKSLGASPKLAIFSQCIKKNQGPLNVARSYEKVEYHCSKVRIGNLLTTKDILKY